MIDRYEILMNPALGSIAISSFVKGFAENNNNKTPLFLCFFVIPMVFQKDIRNEIIHSRSFEKIVANLNKNHKDRLYGINHSIKQMRDLSFKSFVISVSCGLVSLDPKNALISPNGCFKIPEAYSGNSVLKEMTEASEKLGIVLSGKRPSEITRFLNVGV